VDRVGIFLDYENIHRTGHELFSHTNLKKFEFVVNPVNLAETIIRKREKNSILAEIHVFAGKVPGHFGFLSCCKRSTNLFTVLPFSRCW
jgi:hypothetical protein